MLVASRRGLLCAVVEGRDLDPVALGGELLAGLAEHHGAVRAAASRVAPTEALRRSFHEARCALDAITLGRSNGDVAHVASYRDLGSFQLLLSLQDDDALRLFCDSILGPIETSDGHYGDELMRSLEAFIECNGQWERAAQRLYCHRHTLRYRLRRA